MNRKNLLLAILCLLFSPLLCHTAEPAVISVIFSSDIAPYQQCWQGFKEFMEEKGLALWISEYNLKETSPEVIYLQIKNEKPDIVFTIGTKASKLAKEKIKDIPVVFCMVLDPSAIIDLNITGVSMDIPPMMKLKQVKEILPDVKSIGMVYSPKTISRYEEVSQACKELGFQLISWEIDSGKEIPDVLKEISRRIDLFLMIPDAEIYFLKSVEYLLLESLRKKVPVVGLSSYYTKAGALISFDCDYKGLGRQAGEIALRILKGEKSANIQSSGPRQLNFSLNLFTAERLDIRIPPPIIKKASEVFSK